MIIDTNELRDQVNGWSAGVLGRIDALEKAWRDLSGEVERTGRTEGTEGAKGTVRLAVVRAAEPGHAPRKGERRDYLPLCKAAPPQFRMSDISPLTGLSKNGVMSLFTRWVAQGIIRKASWGLYEWTDEAKRKLAGGEAKGAALPVPDADAKHLERCQQILSPFRIRDVCRGTGQKLGAATYLLSKWVRSGVARKVKFGSYEWTARPAPVEAPLARPEYVDPHKPRPGALSLDEFDDSNKPLEVQLANARQRQAQAKRENDSVMERAWGRKVAQLEGALGD